MTDFTRSVCLSVCLYHVCPNSITTRSLALANTPHKALFIGYKTSACSASAKPSVTVMRIWRSSWGDPSESHSPVGHTSMMGLPGDGKFDGKFSHFNINQYSTKNTDPYTNVTDKQTDGHHMTAKTTLCVCFVH